MARNRSRPCLSRDNHALPVSTSSGIRFDTSSMVHFRSSLCYLSDPIHCRTFSFCAHDRGFWPPPPKAIWDPLLPAGPEGPFLPSSVMQLRNGRGTSLRPLLVAHGDHSICSRPCR